MFSNDFFIHIIFFEFLLSFFSSRTYQIQYF